MNFRTISILGLLLLVLAAVAAAKPKERLNVRVVADEAKAVLNILEKRAAGREITESDWKRVFDSEGYVRLKKRELSMSRPFEDAAFREFVMSDDLLKRREALTETLARWKSIDPASAGNKALAYLPRDASITAKIYPVIKPRDNSFVFEVNTDPAIFLYLDPAVDADKFENTLAHELHHIGFGGGCPAPDVKAKREKLPEGVRDAIKWTGAFGEGLAMLAAAGAPNIHPHAVSDEKERAEWDASMINFDADLKKVEAFLLDVAEGRSKGDDQNKAGFEFFGVQGPWYTVGWKMASVIETVYGRERLVESFCDESRLLKTYNSAAKKYERAREEKLAQWSKRLLTHINESD
jgi:hypothetical protein